ncbi:MAG TPA: sigma-70 family RNA polymerase sigma factor [Acidimicrobiales bacterium]|nr:sigma-70 family RNA polymerase sigma factor [Acidimicrobiales bacterium]
MPEPDDRTPASASRGRSLLARADHDTLVDAARGGDRGAFDELVRRTYRETYTLALRLVGDPDDARDVTQESYLRAFRGLKSFRGDAQFTTWLYRITANRAATHLRRRIRNRHDPLTDDLWASEVTDGAPAQIELRHELTQALNTLPPKLRSVVVLRDVYGLPHAEIARELSISESAAKVRLHRARKKLRGELFSPDGRRSLPRDVDGETVRAV